MERVSLIQTISRGKLGKDDKRCFEKLDVRIFI